jgi:hypothetical protein
VAATVSDPKLWIKQFAWCLVSREFGFPKAFPAHEEDAGRSCLCPWMVVMGTNAS